MPSEIIGISEVLRRMRGGSQAFLVRGEDDHFYVAKFAGNPQGNRTLINEWAAHRVLQQLGISTPDMRILRITNSTKRRTELCFQTSGRTMPITQTFHLGSQCPVDPTTMAVYDFLPAKLLSKVINLPDLGRTFVVDKWFGQIDRRQAIFVRDPAKSNDLRLRLYVIDHGLSFGGSQWDIHDSPLGALYMDARVYSMLDMKAICEEMVSHIGALTERDLYSAANDVPSCWSTENDHPAFIKLINSLELRRNRLSSVISRHLEALHLGPSSADTVTDSRIDLANEVLPKPENVLAPALY
jgi:hypothetical protein